MSFDNIKLEKGMYSQGDKTFSQILESLDPSENYSGTPVEGLDAFQRQLKRFDIKVSGTDSDSIQKFFSTSDSAALFPEYISRAVKSGMEEVDRLNEIVATTTKINGLDYRSIVSAPAAVNKKLELVAEGAAIPETSVSVQENLVKLKKHGRMLVASYEALKYQRLDLFTVTLRQIGAYIATQQLADAVNVIVAGDGNSNPAESFNVGTANNLTYADLLNLWNKLGTYEMNTLLVSGDMMMKMLAIPEFQNPNTGLNFQGTGKLTTPMGANLIKSSAVPAKTIIGLDKRAALEKVVAADVAIEYDKLIDRQLERAAITSTAGFAKIFNDASKVLKG